MAFHLLKIFSVGVVATLILTSTGSISSSAWAAVGLPSKSHPIIVDAEKKQVLIYTEVLLKNWDKPNPHWGIVCRGGKLRDKAILSAFCSPEDLHQALVQIGAHPGHSLPPGQNGKFVEGDSLIIGVIRPGHSGILSLGDILFDQTGKGFDFRFGGNLERATKEKTGCLTCLESCPVGITSNAAYPMISSWKRLFSPNSLFRGKKEIVSARDETPVIFIYQVKRPN